MDDLPTNSIATLKSQFQNDSFKTNPTSKPSNQFPKSNFIPKTQNTSSGQESKNSGNTTNVNTNININININFNQNSTGNGNRNGNSNGNGATNKPFGTSYNNNNSNNNATNQNPFQSKTSYGQKSKIPTEENDKVVVQQGNYPGFKKEIERKNSVENEKREFNSITKQNSFKTSVQPSPELQKLIQADSSSNLPPLKKTEIQSQPQPQTQTQTQSQPQPSWKTKTQNQNQPSWQKPKIESQTQNSQPETQNLPAWKLKKVNQNQENQTDNPTSTTPAWKVQSQPPQSQTSIQEKQNESQSQPIPAWKMKSQTPIKNNLSPSQPQTQTQPSWKTKTQTETQIPKQNNQNSDDFDTSFLDTAFAELDDILQKNLDTKPQKQVLNQNNQTQTQNEIKSQFQSPSKDLPQTQTKIPIQSQNKTPTLIQTQTQTQTQTPIRTQNIVNKNSTPNIPKQEKPTSMPKNQDLEKRDPTWSTVLNEIDVITNELFSTTNNNPNSTSQLNSTTNSNVNKPNPTQNSNTNSIVTPSNLDKKPMEGTSDDDIDRLLDELDLKVGKSLENKRSNSSTSLNSNLSPTDNLPVPKNPPPQKIPSPPADRYSTLLENLHANLQELGIDESEFPENRPIKFKYVSESINLEQMKRLSAAFEIKPDVRAEKLDVKITFGNLNSTLPIVRDANGVIILQQAIQKCSGVGSLDSFRLYVQAGEEKILITDKSIPFDIVSKNGAENCKLVLEKNSNNQGMSLVIAVSKCDVLVDNNTFQVTEGDMFYVLDSTSSLWRVKPISRGGKDFLMDSRNLEIDPDAWKKLQYIYGQKVYFDQGVPMSGPKSSKLSQLKAFTSKLLKIK